MTQSRQDRQMAEALARSVEVMEEKLPVVNSLARRFFAGYASDLLTQPLQPGERMEDRVSTALAMAFFAGREHSERGYPSPLEDADIDQIDDLADAWADGEEGRDG